MEEIISYKLEKFEGPLDLLLSLIKKNKVQIEDIPISLICEQYVEYIAKAQKPFPFVMDDRSLPSLTRQPRGTPVSKLK